MQIIFDEKQQIFHLWRFERIFSINARQNPSDFRKGFCFIRISASAAYNNGIAVCQNLLLTYAENVIDYK